MPGRLSLAAAALLGLALLATNRAALAGAASPGGTAALEFVLPGLLSGAAEPRGAPFSRPAVPDAAQLAARALRGAPLPPGELPRVGAAGLLLLLLLAARRPARAAPLLALVALALLVPLPFAGTLLTLALTAGVLAGLGALPPAPDGAPTRGTRADLLVGTLAVLLAAALAALALHAGAATDAELLAPVLERLPGGELPGPATRALAAAHLRGVFDRAALTSFAAMAVLLVHLKERRTWSLLLLVAVALGDLALPV